MLQLPQESSQIQYGEISAAYPAVSARTGTDRLRRCGSASTGCQPQYAAKDASSPPKRRRPVCYCSETATEVRSVPVAHSSARGLGEAWRATLEAPDSRPEDNNGHEMIPDEDTATVKPVGTFARKPAILHGRDGSRFTKSGARGCCCGQIDGKWESTGPPSRNAWTPRFLQGGAPGCSQCYIY